MERSNNNYNSIDLFKLIIVYALLQYIRIPYIAAITRLLLVYTIR